MIAPVIDTAWLVEHRAEVAVADVRWYLRGPRGEEAYDRGHIPGAVFVDLDQVLASPPDPTEGRHPLPEPERFAAALGEIGIGDGDTVVAYDDDGGVIAARLVWMLRTLGTQAALLDGGLAAWRGSLESERVARPRASFSARPWPANRIASIEDVAALVPRLAGAGGAPGRLDGGRDGGLAAILIDARDRARFEGGPDPVDPRSGHIPGARNLPARELASEEGLIAGETALRSRLERAGIGPSTQVVAYCGSGVTACYDLLLVELAGFGPGRLYAGSWSQWSRDPRRALQTGAAR
jgi:thiosulfate/3-mercaptopyruvate sulfurtransferase